MTPRPKPRPGHTSELDKMRRQTNYGARRISGHAPFPKAALGDLMRITGLAGGRVLTLIVAEATGRKVEKDQPFHEVTEPMTVARLAELCFLDERTIQRELKDLVGRKIIKQTKVGKGAYEFQPLFRTWASLPDYVPGPVAEPESEPEADEPESEEEAKDKTVTRLTEKPVRIAAGKKSKPIKVECGVSALRFVANIDADCSAVVQGGVLLVNLEYAKASKSSPAQTSGINNLISSPRQPSRDDSRQATGKGTKGERRTSGEQPKVSHPRADELSSLFDPFLLKSCGKSLSGDPAMLLAACEAIQAVPHDYLVKCVVDRASRPISGGKAVVAICKEIAGNWGKSKDLPPESKLPTREEIDAMIAREQQELAAARRKRRAS